MTQNDAHAAQIAKIIGIVSEVLGVLVSESSSVEDVLGWDSLKTLQLVMALEEAGYEIPLEKIAEIRSIKDILVFGSFTKTES
ncbi:MAG: acyl carrier protein [Synergistaceae bacterium]|jgi:acyl carrier protein|nr:acyl carrier protein [Synergistaceae bacterium]